MLYSAYSLSTTVDRACKDMGNLGNKDAHTVQCTVRINDPVSFCGMVFHSGFNLLHLERKVKCCCAKTDSQRRCFRAQGLPRLCFPCLCWHVGVCTAVPAALINGGAK